jgi:hypothetical protein
MEFMNRQVVWVIGLDYTGLMTFRHQAETLVNTYRGLPAHERPSLIAVDPHRMGNAFVDYLQSSGLPAVASCDLHLPALAA